MESNDLTSYPSLELKNYSKTEGRGSPSPEPLEGKISDFEQHKTQEGLRQFSSLGWKRLTILLIVEAIALGALSIPAAFATLGVFIGVLANIVIGFVAIYTGYIVGKVKVNHPELRHYADVGTLLFGKLGYEVFTFMFVTQLLLLGASHCLTGATAFLTMTDGASCSLVFSLVSAVILFLLSVPPSFAEIAILGYIDLASILIAIGITIIATGVTSPKLDSTARVEWKVWPRQNIKFTEAFVAILNIAFAYGFTVCQFSFMDEMHTPSDFMKSVWSLGIFEIILYTLTGVLIYIFVGRDVESPALLSAGEVVSKIAFGIALPVIFISGAILIVTAGRCIHGRIYANTVTLFINTPKGWITWLATIFVIVAVGWVIAEGIPFFSNLVALSSSLLNSGFTFHFPALMWFRLLRQGIWKRSDYLWAALNSFIFLLGLTLLVGGTYAAVQSIIIEYLQGSTKLSFAC